jgi:very-short-patch-repair endonuclease
LVSSGDLTRVRHGVYATRKAIAFRDEGPVQRHAILAVSAMRVVAGAVVSHHSAALLQGLDMYKAPDARVVALTLPPGPKRCGDETEGIVRYRAALPGDHVVKTFGLQVTSPARTVVDIARTSSFMEGVAVADSALRDHVAPKAVMEEVLEVCAGWPGIERARRVVAFSDMRAESVMESCARVVFHERGLEPPELQVRVARGIRVDFCWPKYKVIVEADGLAKYEDNPRRSVAEQIKRDNVLRRLGYKVIHYVWAELFNQAETLVTDIRGAFGGVR